MSMLAWTQMWMWVHVGAIADVGVGVNAVVDVGR